VIEPWDEILRLRLRMTMGVAQNDDGCGSEMTVVKRMTGARCPPARHSERSEESERLFFVIDENPGA